MTLHILIAYRTLNFALRKEIHTDAASIARDAVNKAGEILKEHGTCKIWATSQAIDKVSKHLSQSQQTKFKDFFSEEFTTRGVASFTPETSTPESAAELALSGSTIVLDECLDGYKQSNRIVVLHPKEWSMIYDDVCNIYKLIDTMRQFNVEVPDSEFSDLLWAGCSNHPEFKKLADRLRHLPNGPQDLVKMAENLPVKK